MIHLIVGNTGSGKTTYSNKLKNEINAITFSIDKWNIILSGYSDNPKGRILSDLKIIDVNSSKLPTEIKFDKALGIRIFYEYGIKELP